MAADAHVAALVRLVRAVARREVLPGYSIAAVGSSASGLTLIETWRGPRFAALVFEAGHPASDDADGSAGLAGTIGDTLDDGRVVALWLAAAGTGRTGGRLARGGGRDRRTGRAEMNARNGFRHSPRPLQDDPGDAGAVRRRQLLLFSVIAAALLAGGGRLARRGRRQGSGGPQGGIEAGDRRSLTRPRRSGRSALRGAARRDRDEAPRDCEREARSLRTDNDRLAHEAGGATPPNARDVIDRQAAMIDELQRQARAAERGNPTISRTTGRFEGFPARRASAPAPSGAQGQAAPLAMPQQHDRDLRTGGCAPQSVPTDPSVSDRGDPRNGGDTCGRRRGEAGLGLAARRARTQRRWCWPGVDASAGVSSQGDPRPVLHAHHRTGLDGRRGRRGASPIDVDGCTVTGAAHGDLSSEKVYVRFRTMTCAGPQPGTVVETDVAGFVAGSGKTGVRGPVVSREGALVERAFLAGMVSGAGPGRRPRRSSRRRSPPGAEPRWPTPGLGRHRPRGAWLRGVERRGRRSRTT